MRTKRVLLIILAFWSLNLVQSCREEHFLIVGINFQGAFIEELGEEALKNHYSCTNEFLDDIIFIISYNTEFIAQADLYFTSNQCYALTRPNKIDNELVRSTFSISFDDFFVYNGDTIYARENILANESIYSEIGFSESSMTFCGSGADIVMDFSDRFVSNSVFQNKLYEVSFSSHTSDSLIFEVATEINFKL